MNPNEYEIAVVGGGLAGLALSIQAAKSGYKTVLIEKETYPFHRVCGEYISLESLPFLESLGLPVKGMELPLIKELHVSAPNGSMFKTELPLGGFGISRYTLDLELSKIAKASGVVVLENHKVRSVEWEKEQILIEAEGKIIKAQLAAGAYGKRSNLDIKWNRTFIQHKASGLSNYIGVKYHIRTHHPENVIALHNFENGYCGISKIENNRYCLCYLTTAANLRKYNNRIDAMEKNVLQKNPYLKQLFTNSEFLIHPPVSISQISFEKKTQIENHLLLAGDAAGMITPLCGNGMSMALHGSKIAFTCMAAYLEGHISRSKMEEQYQRAWQKQFSGRLKTGRIIQRFFGRPAVTNLFIGSFKLAPFLARPLIRMTHGSAF